MANRVSNVASIKLRVSSKSCFGSHHFTDMANRTRTEIPVKKPTEGASSGVAMISVGSMCALEEGERALATNLSNPIISSHHLRLFRCQWIHQHDIHPIIQGQALKDGIK